MIQTAAIIWAVLATGLGIAAAVISERAIREARAALALADEAFDERDRHRSIADALVADYQSGRLKRHLAAKKARAAQLAQRAAASTTEQIRKEIGR